MGSRRGNSRDSYEKCRQSGEYVRLVHKIARHFENNFTHQLTDRHLKDRLWECGILPHNDMNMVRPKITKLIQDGLLKECGKTYDRVTKRNVRLVCWNDKPKQEQRELF